MATFTVHVPPSMPNAGRRAERTVFVRDGFSLPAFLFGPLFLLYRRLWLSALAWIVLAALLGFAGYALRLGPANIAGLFLLLGLLTGLEAPALRQRALDRRGYIAAGLLARRSRDEAEGAFFAAEALRDAAPRQAPAVSGPMAVSGPPRLPMGGEDVIGLFPRSGDGV